MSRYNPNFYHKNVLKRFIHEYVDKKPLIIYHQVYSFKEKGKDTNKLTSLYENRLSVFSDNKMIYEPIISQVK